VLKKRDRATGVVVDKPAAVLMRFGFIVQMRVRGRTCRQHAEHEHQDREQPHQRALRTNERWLGTRGWHGGTSDNKSVKGRGSEVRLAQMSSAGGDAAQVL